MNLRRVPVSVAATLFETASVVAMLIGMSQAQSEFHAKTAYADCEGKMQNVEVHAGPQSSTRLLQTLGCDEPVTVIGKADNSDWFKVKTQRGVEGFVWMFLSDNRPAVSAMTVSAKDKALNGDPEQPLPSKIMVPQEGSRLSIRLATAANVE